MEIIGRITIPEGTTYEKRGQKVTRMPLKAGTYDIVGPSPSGAFINVALPAWGADGAPTILGLATHRDHLHTGLAEALGVPGAVVELVEGLR